MPPIKSDINMANAELLTHKHLATIVELQKLAMSMTLEEFIDFVKTNYSYRDYESLIDFDYYDLTATICIDSKTLSGCIDIWNEEGTWRDTFFCQSVPFKK